MSVQRRVQSESGVDSIKWCKMQSGFIISSLSEEAREDAVALLYDALVPGTWIPDAK
jgi:hypothetical protein